MSSGAVGGARVAFGVRPRRDGHFFAGRHAYGTGSGAMAPPALIMKLITRSHRGAPAWG